MLQIKIADELPKLRRGGGRTSKDRKLIQQLLQDGNVHVIEDIEVDKPYNALQQRVRQAAAQIGVRVTIRQVKHEDNPEKCDLFFTGLDVSSTEIKEISTV